MPHSQRTYGTNKMNLRCKRIEPRFIVHRTLGANQSNLRCKFGRPKVQSQKAYISLTEEFGSTTEVLYNKKRRSLDLLKFHIFSFVVRNRLFRLRFLVWGVCDIILASKVWQIDAEETHDQVQYRKTETEHYKDARKEQHAKTTQYTHISRLEGLYQRPDLPLVAIDRATYHTIMAAMPLTPRHRHMAQPKRKMYFTLLFRQV